MTVPPENRLERPIDLVSEALQSLPVTGTLFCRAELSAPWGVFSESSPHAIFHVVLQGSARLRVGELEIELRERDVALMPRGTGHEMEDAPGRDKVSLRALPMIDTGGIHRAVHGGGGDGTWLLCGKLHFDPIRATLVQELLPPLVHTSLDQAFVDWLVATLTMIDFESRQSGAGIEVVATKLADIVFTQLLRCHLNDPSSERRGWLAAMMDARLGRAMTYIHREPGERWTVERLAAKAGMSRSMFSARFTDVVGESPARYLSRWRMYCASLELRDGDPGLAEIADRLGYESPGAFSKAFKRTMGISPREFRRASREAVS